MQKFFEKSEIGFAIFWIVLYIVLSSVAEEVSNIIGVAKSITCAVHILMSLVLLLWILKNKHTEYLGLCKSKVGAKYLLFYIPLVVMISTNLWFGVECVFGVLESILFVISMLCVGFLEEIIFRGLLFRAMEKDSLKWAIAVTSLTFGIGHIINLISGNLSLLSGVCQIVYSFAAGFLFVILFYKSGTLIPCIITHSVFNALSVVFNNSAMTTTTEIILAGVLTVLSLGYAITTILLTKNKTKEEKTEIEKTL